MYSGVNAKNLIKKWRQHIDFIENRKNLTAGLPNTGRNTQFTFSSTFVRFSVVIENNIRFCILVSAYSYF